MKFNIVWATNAALLFVTMGLIKVLAGAYDDGFATILLFGTISFVVGGLVGLKKESSFDIRSQNYWAILVLLTIAAAFGRSTLHSWLEGMNNTYHSSR